MKTDLKLAVTLIMLSAFTLSGHNGTRADLSNLKFIPQEKEEPILELFEPGDRLDLSDLIQIGMEEELPAKDLPW